MFWFAICIVTQKKKLFKWSADAADCIVLLTSYRTQVYFGSKTSKRLFLIGLDMAVSFGLKYIYKKKDFNIFIFTVECVNE